MSSPLAIRRIDVCPLDVPLAAPFVVSTARLDVIHNVAVRLELADGSVGWGEAPTLPPITTEDQPRARATIEQARSLLLGADARRWRVIAAQLAERFPEDRSARAGLEMALIDALARSQGVALWQWFGGAGATLVTDITIPMCAPADAAALAADYAARGFTVVKTKIGLDAGADLARLRAIRQGHPHCRLVLDANEGHSAQSMLALLRELRAADMEPVLLEQPVPRADWAGLARLAREAGVPIAADESCRSAGDALRIAAEGLAQVINIKIAKCGVVEALDIAAVARAAGLGLMIGGMVETRLGMGFSAHFAAGLGGFEWIDLDTPLLLAEDPVIGGYASEGPRYDLDRGEPGHGGTLRGCGD